MDLNVSASECTSGCESGWTLYLDQSSISDTQFRRDSGVGNYAKKGAREVEDVEEEVQEEEDLSMVSDASSGPPHYQEDDEDCFCENGCSYSAFWVSGSVKKVKKEKNMEEKCKNEPYSYLDDTASSPVSKRKMKLSRNRALGENVTGSSQSFPATHFKGKTTLNKHFNLLHFSLAKSSSSEEPGDFHGRNCE